MKEPGIEVQHMFVWMDLGYTVQMTRFDQFISFSVFRIAKIWGNMPLYEAVGDDLHALTPKTDFAVPFVEGEMTWDFCLDLECNQEPMTLHFRHVLELRNFNRMTRRLYKSAHAFLMAAV